MTLEDAINGESTTSTEKSTQLGFLSTSTKALEKPEVEQILKDNAPGSGTTQTHVDEIRDLCKWRIENDMTIVPFTGLDLGTVTQVY